MKEINDEVWTKEKKKVYDDDHRVFFITVLVAILWHLLRVQSN